MDLESLHKLYGQLIWEKKVIEARLAHVEQQLIDFHNGQTTAPSQPETPAPEPTPAPQPEPAPETPPTPEQA